MSTIENSVLEILDEEEGTEAHMIMSFTRRQVSAAFQRLQRKGLATAVQCPDGAWVWYLTVTVRESMCDGCPFNPERVGPALDHDTRATVARRIRQGERWICHQTCDGARVTAASQFCAGAPQP